jgi:spore maturation protein CgeB
MAGQESLEERNKRLEKEILNLREENETISRREKILLKRLKDYETIFYKELNAQIQIYKQSWTWRIGRLVVGPADFILRLLKSKKKAAFDRTTSLKGTDPASLGGKPDKYDDISNLNTDNQILDDSKINIAVIFDTFTQSCFSPEFNTICFNLSNWKKVLESVPVKALFIESAWRGIDDSWRDKIAEISGNNQSEVLKLVEWAKNQNIPRIFWNKEDPVHFQQFIKLAKNFDYIFTTDADCIPDYQKQAPYAVINSLPFAAQPKIHNPVAEIPRNKSVCFAGTYYDQRYHERKADMDFLLKPSLDYGLEIFDRHYGDTSKIAVDFRFPGIYHEAIKGKLDYNDMVKAYKQYKVFLNVNSVKYSSTMFARRVFELLASGTPVISTYSQGIINILGEDTVFISESESDTRKHLDYLLGNELNWWKASLKGLRTVMENHTYEERTRFIFDVAGLETKPVNPAKFSVVTRVSSIEEIEYLEKMLRQQSFTGIDIVLVLSGEEINPDVHSEGVKSLFSPFAVRLLKENSGTFAQDILSASDSEFLAFLHADHYYGPNYLRDYVIALKYTHARILGKKSFYRISQGEQLIKVNEGFDYHYVTTIPNATSVVSKSALDGLKLKDYLFPGEIVDPDYSIFSLDSFNYLGADFRIKQGILQFNKLNEINL